ncbi:uncharacterized protein LOC109716361 isoform X5 [Ananas comosus]|uniref:Uncharacterized protein LOC109716361 isoform X5 n=1 Tax=Ananas comosus TaxID=4615 RepID=A0A6P5FNV2_ANACO|nr:uncharacterized protein LOC109716361 isoform X5 [Ananas comosus]
MSSLRHSLSSRVDLLSAKHLPSSRRSSSTTPPSTSLTSRANGSIGLLGSKGSRGRRRRSSPVIYGRLRGGARGRRRWRRGEVLSTIRKLSFLISLNGAKIMMLDYNVPGGKLNRGLSVIDSYKLLKAGVEVTEDEIFLGCALNWLVH